MRQNQPARMIVASETTDAFTFSSPDEIMDTAGLPFLISIAGGLSVVVTAHITHYSQATNDLDLQMLQNLDTRARYLRLIAIELNEKEKTQGDDAPKIDLREMSFELSQLIGPGASRPTQLAITKMVKVDEMVRELINIIEMDYTARPSRGFIKRFFHIQ